MKGNPKSQIMEVYTIVDKEGFERSFWLKIGAAFRNRDNSINLYLDALPLNGRLQIRSKDDNPNGREGNS